MAYSNIYFKSLVWLVSFGGIGWVLMEITSPSEKKLQEIRNTKNGAALTDDQLKKLQFIKRMREITNEDTSSK